MSYLQLVIFPGKSLVQSHFTHSSMIGENKPEQNVKAYLIIGGARVKKDFFECFGVFLVHFRV